MSNLRVYPIRKSRNKWKIPLFCYHICNDLFCKIKIIEDKDTDYLIIENPEYIDGKCISYNKLTPTYVRLCNFDINNPKTEIGTLYNPDMIVIHDNKFSVSIDFPLSYKFEVNIISPYNKGFSLKELIFSIKNLYEYIYNEEERTASTHNYNLKKICTSCGNKDLSKFVKNEIDDKNGFNEKDNCSICISDFTEDNNYIKLKCTHFFHNLCIKKWTETNGTCPVCRYNIFECENCDGSGIIYYNFTGVVIPVENRPSNLRNITNGVFGIYNYDLEDLYIKSMRYDRIKKKLELELTV